MEMQQIRYFLALARTLNFTRAAEECNVSQSALTRAIQALEGELGGELVRREHSRSHLTELGKRMLPLVERCYESAMTAKALAKSIAREDLAPLAVGVSDSVNVELIMGPLAEMFRSFSGLQLKLHHGGGAAIMELLKQGGAEIAVAGPIDDNWERLDRWALFEEPFELAIRSDNPLAMDNEITLEKLQTLPVFCQGGCEMHDAATSIVASKGFATANMHEVVTYHDLIALVSNGVGAAIVPRSAPQSDTVKRTAIADLGLSRTVSVYAVAGRRRGAAAAAFLNLLRSADFAIEQSQQPRQ
jgi:DNA-binding transcriptional LysR family regulator